MGVILPKSHSQAIVTEEKTTITNRTMIGMQALGRVASSLVLLLCLVTSSTQAFYSKRDAVQELTSKDFDKQVIRGKGVWMVEFYAPWCGHCKNLAPEWKKAAKLLDGVVNVAAVDCDQHKDIAGRFGVQGFPTIKVFGADKYKPTDYQGQRDAPSIAKHGMKQAKALVKARLDGKKTDSKDKTKSNKKDKKDKSKFDDASKKKGKKGNKPVVKLTDSNFKSEVYGSDELWMVEFYAPWCGHCKQLEPEWHAAGASLMGSGVKFGAVDATSEKQLASEFGIQGFPTIKVFKPNSARANDAYDYRLGRDRDSLIQFGQSEYIKHGGKPVAPFKELTGATELEDHCGGDSTICVVSFLPHISNSQKSGRDRYLNVIEKVAKSSRGKPFRFGWIQASDQPAWEQEFGLTFGFPSVVALSLDKGRYIVQRGSFTESSIMKFLNGIMSGSERPMPYSKLPKLNDVTGWDGKDAPVMEEDDEDLGDIMAEILGDSGKDEL